MEYRIYAASLMAVNRTAQLETQFGTELAHRGIVCIEKNIEEVAKKCKEYIYKLYPVERGYSLHSVTVTPLKSPFLDTFRRAIDSGKVSFIANPTEELRTFNFDPDVTNDFYFDIDGQEN